MIKIRPLLLGLCLLLASCVTPVSATQAMASQQIDVKQRLILYPEPAEARLTTADFIATLALCDLTNEMYHGLKLTITNISRQKLVIDFNNIWYTIDGRQHGGVIISEVTRDKVSSVKPAYAILPGETYSKNIWPERMSAYTNRWEHQPLPLGEHGLIFILRQGDRLLQEQLALSLKKTYAPAQ